MLEYPKTFVKRFCGDEQGATAIEYGLIAAIIGVGIIAALNGTITELVGAFQSVIDSFQLFQ